MTSIHDKFRYVGHFYAENVPDYDNVAVGQYLQPDDNDFDTLVKVDTVVKEGNTVTILGWYCVREDDWEDSRKERAKVTLNRSDSVWLYDRWAFDNPLTPVGTM